MCGLVTWIKLFLLGKFGFGPVMQDARLQVKLKLKYFADLFLFWTEQ